ncbi:MAG: phage holin family protein [Pseudomonadota bacterium]
MGRIATTFAAILRTRVELAALELEEESRRLIGYLLLALASMFLLGLATILLAFFVIALFWDTHRLAAVLSLAGLFTVAGVALGLKVRNSFASKPKLLGDTLAELSKDINFIKMARQSDEH